MEHVPNVKLEDQPLQPQQPQQPQQESQSSADVVNAESTSSSSSTTMDVDIAADHPSSTTTSSTANSAPAPSLSSQDAAMSTVDSSALVVPKSTSPSPSSSLPNPMVSTPPDDLVRLFPPLRDIPEDQLDTMVLRYLESRGFRVTHPRFSELREVFRNDAIPATQPPQRSSTASASAANRVSTTVVASHLPISGSLEDHIVSHGVDSRLPRHRVLRAFIPALTPGIIKEQYRAFSQFIESMLPQLREELSQVTTILLLQTYCFMLDHQFAAEADEFISQFRHHHGTDLDEFQLYEKKRRAGLLEAGTPVPKFSAVLNATVIRLSELTFDLLWSFLQERRMHVFLYLIATHVNIAIRAAFPHRLEGTTDAVADFGRRLLDVNKQPWGQISQITELKHRAAQAVEDAIADLNATGAEAKSKSAKRAAEAKASASGSSSSSSISSSSGSGSGSSSAPASASGELPLPEDEAERNRVVEAAAKRLKLEEPPAPTNPRDPMAAPQPSSDPVPLPTLTPAAKQGILRDLLYRATVSSTHLPSVAMYTFLNSQHSVTSTLVSSDASVVVAGYSDSTIRMWDMTRPELRGTAASRNASVDDLLEIPSSTCPQFVPPAFAPPTPSELSEASGFEPVLRPSSSPSAPYVKLIGHSGAVFSTSLSPDQQFLLSSSEDSTVRLWHVPTARNVVCFKGHNFPVWDVQFSPMGFYFATASHDRTARLWCTMHIHPLRMLVGHHDDVDVVRFHPNCNYVATGSSDSTLRLWDVSTGECMRVFVGHRGPITALAMSPDGSQMVSGGEDGQVIVWDLAKSRIVQRWQAAETAVSASATFGHQSRVTSLSWSADNHLIASGSLDQTVRLWCPKRALGNTTSARNGHLAAAAASNGSRDLLRTFTTKSTPVTFVQFTPRNLLLAAGVFS